MGVHIATNKYSIITFAWQGKTMIGKIYAIGNEPTTVTNANTIISSFIKTSSESGQDSTKGGKDDFYYIESPCIVDYEIVKPKTGSATVEWSLIPLYYKALLGETPHQITFAFPRSETVISSVGDDFLNSKLVAAWKQLCM